VRRERFETLYLVARSRIGGDIITEGNEEMKYLMKKYMKEKEKAQQARRRRREAKLKLSKKARREKASSNIRL